MCFEANNLKKEGRKGRRKEGREEGRKEGRKESQPVSPDFCLGLVNIWKSFPKVLSLHVVGSYFFPTALRCL